MMGDAALDNAHSRRGALAAQINVQQQRLEELRRELQLVDEFIARWHTFAVLAADEPLIRSEVSVDNSSENEKRRRPVNPSRESVGNVVEALLKEWGRPASRRRLFDELPNHDIHLQGRDPEMVFSTMLWRMQDRFERVPKRGYWLKGVPVPDNSDVPDDLADLLG